MSRKGKAHKPLPYIASAAIMLVAVVAGGATIIGNVYASKY